LVKTAIESLKKAIDLKNSVQMALKKYDDLNIEILDKKPVVNDTKTTNKITAEKNELKVTPNEKSKSAFNFTYFK
jgi:hypothetical protein